MGEFAPFLRGSATRGEDGRVTGTFAVKSDVAVRIVAVAVDESGTFVTMTFDPVEEEE